MNRDGLSSRVSRTIIECELISRGDKLVCGISGGPDSVCMVHILTDWRRELGFEMVLAHVNYHTRGDDSDLDEDLCRKLATDLGIDMHVRAVDQEELILLKNGNFQRDARHLRYEFFARLLADIGCNKIATGHTADDVAETSLMHYVRGAGISGIGGIYPTNGNLIRPLIDCYRDEIISYLSEKRITYRIDSSNLESKYLRNRVRNQLIPLLSENYNSRVVRAIARTAHIAQATGEFLEKHVDRLWRDSVSSSRLGKILIDVRAFTSGDKILRYELIRKAYNLLLGEDNHRTSLDLELIESADRLTASEVGRRADLNSGISIERGSDQLVIFRNDVTEVCERVDVPGITRLEDFSLEVLSEICDFDGEIAKSSDCWDVQLDFDRLTPPFLLRTFRDGDRVRLLNSPGSRKLSNILIDRKIPRSLRSEIPILTAADEIVWIVGVGITDSAKLTAQTEKVLKLHAKSSVIQE
ncbi:MAG: tRNA lysidine(34) synthetase TilS [candidate division Zixibacteria bacterium]|nr:tRNA lysidine(34) synthetase TilS [candidate division Zixibacteria bacterium]MBU1470492.1 tRNA lysidine(34) synthetase TilS [candidate division Zixibacteria bacterium]